MASLENDRPQSTTAVRRKSKGKKKVSDTTGKQSQKLVEVGMLDASLRMVIAPAKTGFFPATQSINAIMDSIKSFYCDAWSSWEEIPTDDKEHMWNHFQTKCAWYPQHDYQIWYNFDVNAAFMLNNILGSAWEKNQKPDWMLEGIWGRLIEKRIEKLQKTIIQVKEPRASSNKDDLLLIGGSAGVGTHQRKSEKKKRRTMSTYDEVCEEKHVKNNKDGHTTLVESHVEKTNVGYKRRLDEPTSEADSSDQSPDDDEASILSKKIGRVKKGKARGLGPEHCAGCVMYGFASAALESPENQEEINLEIHSLQGQVEKFWKEQKADRLRLAGLENLVHRLIDDCRPEESDDEN